MKIQMNLDSQPATNVVFTGSFARLRPEPVPANGGDTAFGIATTGSSVPH